MNAPLLDYFAVYGGVRALVRSPYLWAALIFSLVSHSMWYGAPWFDVVLATLPNLLGFSIGGFAIFLSLGDTEFRRVICGDDETGTSPYMTFAGTFMHFVVVQILALLLALLARSHPLAFLQIDLNQYVVVKILVEACNFFGYFTYVYAVLLSLAAVASIWRIARNYDADVAERHRGPGGT